MISNLVSLTSNLASQSTSWLVGVFQFEIRDSRSALTLLAYRPFLDPAPIDRYWLWLLPPLILVIALVYRTIKSDSLVDLPRQAWYLAFQISVFMVLAATALWLLLLFL